MKTSYLHRAFAGLISVLLLISAPFLVASASYANDGTYDTARYGPSSFTDSDYFVSAVSASEICFTLRDDDPIGMEVRYWRDERQAFDIDLERTRNAEAELLINSSKRAPFFDELAVLKVSFINSSAV